MEKIKSIFLPKTFVDGNPYITQLSDNLEKVGIELVLPGISSSTTFFLPLVILREKADFIHLHWLDPFFAYQNQFNILKLLVVVLQLVLLKLFGIKIIWTVHNLKNHESVNFIFDRIYSIIVAELSNAIITHCQVAKEETVKQFSIRNKDKVFVVPHGNYIDFYENKIEKAAAREKLGLKDSNLVFLFLGSIRPYKGVFQLIDTFNQLHSEKIQLVIAGRVHLDNQEITDTLRQKIANDQRIKFFPGFVPNDEIQLYMNACDAVIFPYRDILTSGAVLLAMSFGKACIAPRKGCIGEVLDDAGAFLYQIDDQNGLINAINSAVKKHDELFLMGEHNLQLAKEYNWKYIAKMTADVYYHC
ncbi:MAG: glycosyltransferase family 4 protein [Nostoc sp. CmiVER01]|uniref:glycosyltransferase family 4 protein n=1 Tax=Nostoc sp. CmiVER01 TaxID=3075384 RepID=UPI002AD48599|nr:glycosyltransferase family 4 protein [Nostoc sp. CmiVER01]MDZ8122779.1 glycosyltransferase family 4 protein [Nostoc sp. CmiVER01]